MAVEMEMPFAETVTVSLDTLRVDQSDGLSISVPLVWYPRLLRATAAKRERWRLIGRGSGTHWENLDEDVNVEGLLAGKPSGESQASFSRWLANRPSHPAIRSTRTHAKQARADWREPFKHSAYASSPEMGAADEADRPGAHTGVLQ